MNVQDQNGCVMLGIRMCTGPEWPCNENGSRPEWLCNAKNKNVLRIYEQNGHVMRDQNGCVMLRSSAVCLANAHSNCSIESVYELMGCV